MIAGINRQYLLQIFITSNKHLTIQLTKYQFALQSIHVRKSLTSVKQLPLTLAFIIPNQLVQYDFTMQNEAPNYFASAHVRSHRNIHFSLGANGTNT